MCVAHKGCVACGVLVRVKLVCDSFSVVCAGVCDVHGEGVVWLAVLSTGDASPPECLMRESRKPRLAMKVGTAMHSQCLPQAQRWRMAVWGQMAGVRLQGDCVCGVRDQTGV